MMRQKYLIKKSFQFIKILAVFFIGLCNPLFAQVVNTESFDESYFPANWWSISGSNSSYLFTTGSGANPTQSPNSGSGEIEFNSYALASGTEDLISPVIDWSGRGASTPTVSFYFYRDRTAYNTAGYNSEGVNVYVNTSASLTGATFLGFVPRRGGEAPTATTGWHQYSYNIPAGYNGCTNFIIFDFVSAYGDNCFMDDVSFTSYPTGACNCTAPTAQSTSLVLNNITSTSIIGSFTASSPSADGYLVVQTTSASAPTNPVNGTNYLAGASALGGTIVASGTATTFTATGLSSNTQYWYWIYAMNNSLCPPSYFTTLPLSGNATTLSGKNWIGAGAGGAGTDFNTATNWSPSGVPGATDEAIIITTTAAVITLSANATIGALTIKNNATTGITLALDAQNRALLINNELNASINVSGGLSTILSLRVGNSGNITVGGDAYLGANSNISSYIEFVGSGSTSTTGTVTFKGNVVFGQTYYPSTANSIGTFIWDGTGTQTIYTNDSYNPYLNGSSQIGNSNTPSVILSDTYLGNLQTYTSGKNLTVNAGATLDLTTNTWNATNASGTFTNNGILRIAGTTGGQTGSNFPFNYSTNTLATASTVEYYGTSAQTIFASSAYGNLTLTNNAVKTAGAALTVNGTTTINSSATFAASTFTHNFKGNFINNGTFTSNTSTAIFSGTSAQTVSGSSATTFYKLTVNNTSTGVTLSLPVNISNALALTSGLLNTDATNILTMQNGSVAPALTSASTTYVNGPLKYQKSTSGSTALNFPIGTSPDCRPFTLTVNHATTTLYNYTAQLFNANPWAVFGSVFPSDMPTATVDTISGVHYWTINRTDASSDIQPSLDLTGNQQIQLYFGTNDGVYQGSALTIVKNTNATPATWIDIGGTSALGNFSSAQAGSVTSSSAPTAFNSFSSFSLGSRNTGWNPLPIELLSFTAIPNGDKVDVKWETATETNNAYFTIEKSTDGKNFTKLIDVPGAGNSTSYRDYAETDYQPYNGTSYYRLKQTDNNGAFKYFTMVPVTFKTDGQQSMVLYPNPINNETNLNVEVNGFKNQEVVVVLRDVQGKEFLSKVLLSKEDNHIFIIDETKLLPQGTYIITASSNDKIYNYKLIVR